MNLSKQKTNPKQAQLSKTKKTVILVIGFICLALGILGIVVPLLPTTPFLLLAAACFVRASDRLYQWLINHKLFGLYIRNYREHRAISLKIKISSIALLWITILFSMVYIVDSLAVRVILAIIGIGVTIHILHYKTLKE